MSQDCRVQPREGYIFECGFCYFVTASYDDYLEHECDIDEEEKEDESK